MNLVKIKNYTRYAISENGVIKNIQRDETLQGSINGSGYLQYRLTNDLGITVTWGIHRLLCWVFKAKYSDISGLVINHIDGIKLNNALDNLEIITYQENSEHAGMMGLSEKCKPISVRDVYSGKVTKYPSIISYSRDSGISKDVIAARCHNGEDKIYSDGCQYKFGHDDFKDLPTLNKLSVMMETGRLKPMIVRNILTGETLEFDRSSDAAKYLDCSYASISKWYRNPEQPILKGFYQIQALKDMVKWIDHDNIIERYEQDNNVRCVYVFVDEWKLFNTAKEAASYLGITTTSLDYRLRSKGLTKFKDGTRCAYYSDWSPLLETVEG